MAKDSRPVLTASLLLVRAVGVLVPRPLREAWRREWEGEIQNRWTRLGETGRLAPGSKLDLLRRALGTVPDATWLRRQFTADADLVHDLRHGLRVLRRRPGFAAAAVAVLGLGIASSTAVFSVVDGLLLRPLPYPAPERVVTLWQTSPKDNLVKDEVAPANFFDWRERSRSFQHLAAAIPSSYDYTGGGEPEVFFALQVSEGFFDALAMKPHLGRTFRAEEHQAGREKVVLLTHGLWQRRFGGDPGLVDRTISLEGEPYTVVGVLPPEFDLGLLPTSGPRGIFTPHVLVEHDRIVRSSGWWNAVARLKPEVTLAAAQAEMDTIALSLARENPRTNKGMGVKVQTLAEHLASAVRPALRLVVAAVALVLLITWINVAGLLLARGTERERELAIRASLGAGRRRLLRQLLAESALLAALGCAMGLGLARWTLRAMVALTPVDVPRMDQVGLDGRIVGFGILLSVLTSLACGIAPALRFSRPRLGRSLKEARRNSTAGRGQQRLRLGLAVCQVALALVLLVAAGLLTRSFVALLRVDPGFRAEKVVALQVFAWDRQTTPEKRARFFAETLGGIGALPGITAVGAVSRMPFIEANINIRSPLHIDGRGDEDPFVYLSVATPGYFDVMGIPLRGGRPFDEQDRGGRTPVALVNETLARRYWPGEDPVGQRVGLRFEGKPIRAEVVGVVGSVRHERLDRPPEPEAFLPHAQFPYGSMTYVASTTGDPAGSIGAAKRRIWEVDPLQSFYRTATLPELLGRSLAERRFLLVLLGAFAGLALVLAAFGLYALMSFLAAQRTQEIGLRVALGARGADILKMVLAQGAGLVLAGLGLGLVSVFGLAPLLRGLLFGISPSDPATVALTAALLAAVALLACYLPARRAMRVDPAVALRID